MEADIWLDPIDGTDRYRAGNSMFDLVVEADSREQVIEDLRLAIKSRMQPGTEIVRLNITRKHVAARETPEVLFLIPNLTRPYFTRLVSECEKAIATELGDTLRSIVRYDSGDQKNLDGIIQCYSRELRQSSRIRFVVVMPNGNNDLGEDIARITNGFQRDILVISLSLPFKRIKTSFAIRPPYVICESQKGTMALADDAATRLKAKGKSSANVALIQGSKGRVDSRARVRGFLKGMKKELEITLADQIAFDSSKGLYGDWSRSLSERIFTDLVEASPQSIDVVFAANDEMALGVFDSIKKFKNSKSHHHRKVARCLVYGFDALEEMVKRIKEDDPNLKGTIEQPAGAMAKALVKLISQALKRASLLFVRVARMAKRVGRK